MNSDITTSQHSFVDEPLDKIENQNKKNIKAYRAKLRQKILSQKVINPSIPLKYTGTFHGYGDSGQYNHDSGDEEVDYLFGILINKYCTFDWYNDEGGGGDLCWEVMKDVITLNGYQNVIKVESVIGDMEI